MLCVSAVPRFRDLGRPSLTYDEYYDYADSLAFCRAGTLARPVSDGFLNGQAPFSAACLFYRVFGEHERVARALSATAGLAAVAATGLVAAWLIGWRWGLSAGLLAGLAPFAVSSSRLAFSHGHVFQVPCVLMGLYAVLRRRAGGGGGWTWAAGLAFGAAAGCDLLALFWLPTALGLLLGAERGSRRRAAAALAFGLAWVLGLGVASPMYVLHPLEALADVRGRLGFWDQVNDYLWLGEERPGVPAYYYGLVLLTKMNPLVLALFALGVAANLRRGAVCRPLLLALWPIVYLSFKPWKSPYYLAAFVPLVVIVALDGLRWLAVRGRTAAARRRVAVGGVGAAAALSAALGAAVHPDYLMLGIHYGGVFYGEFQGPAVAHGQWVGEALEFIRDGAGTGDPRVMVPFGSTPAQIAFYAERHGLRHVFTVAERGALGLSRHDVDYLVVTQDCRRRAWDRGLNRTLLAFADDGRTFERVRVFRSGPLEMVEVYRRRAPAGGQAGPGAGVPTPGPSSLK